MPGRLKAKILAGRHLPVMDRASDLTDAFVEVKFGNTIFKTEVYPKSLNPQWNSEWFKFEVDDEDLQDEPLQIRVLDHDTYSAHDAIGKVYIDISPLLSSEAATAISGWFPIYDTIHGIRGEINVMVKVDLFSDFNRFRQSSCGVKFFCSPCVPECYRMVAIQGFVEELLVNEDPEYKWIDRIRSPRASNEARQRLISLMSGELQRKIGLKVLEMRGNAVVGYLQCFDLEGESGLVVRAIGTACILERQMSRSLSRCNSPSSDIKESPTDQNWRHTLSIPLPTPSTSNNLCQGFSVSVPSLVFTGLSSPLNLERQKDLLSNSQMLLNNEFPFFTLTHFPPSFLLHLGGMVSARSVKPLGRNLNPVQPGTHDAWWQEIRQEVLSHATALGCRAVVGYSESTSICEDVCILSASGTAAILDPRSVQNGSVYGDEENRMFWSEDTSPTSCSFFHVPYDKLSPPLPEKQSYCCMCYQQWVPDVIFSTTEVPKEAGVVGKGCFIQARLYRLKKKGQGEANTTAISSLLPFMEYELHSQLMLKLKLRGMNALFGLRVQISVGQSNLVGLASATGVYLAALPSPKGIQIAGHISGSKQYITEMQNRINDTIANNKKLYQITPQEITGPSFPLFRVGPRPSERLELVLLSDLDLSYDKKDTFVLEIDDIDTVDFIESLITDDPTPAGFHSCSTEVMPGIHNWTSNTQMFTSVRVFRLNPCLSNTGLSQTFNDLCQGLLKSFYFKLRSMVPCCLCHLNFSISVPEEELIQVITTAVALSLDKNQVGTDWKLRAEGANMKGTGGKIERGRLSLDVGSESLLHRSFSRNGFQESGNIDQKAATSVDTFANKCNTWIEFIKVKARTIRHGSIRSKKSSPPPDSCSLDMTPFISNSVSVVRITPLCFVPGFRTIRYLGFINMFFIRQTMYLREGGDVSGFLHTFIAEVNAMVRAHVAALGGNWVLSHSMKECVIMQNPHKNQAQCLINVCGDVVLTMQTKPSPKNAPPQRSHNLKSSSP